MSRWSSLINVNPPCDCIAYAPIFFAGSVWFRVPCGAERKPLWLNYSVKRVDGILWNLFSELAGESTYFHRFELYTLHFFGIRSGYCDHELRIYLCACLRDRPFLRLCKRSDIVPRLKLSRFC